MNLMNFIINLVGILGIIYYLFEIYLNESRGLQTKHFIPNLVPKSHELAKFRSYNPSRTDKLITWRYSINNYCESTWMPNNAYKDIHQGSDIAIQYKNNFYFLSTILEIWDSRFRYTHLEDPRVGELSRDRFVMSFVLWNNKYAEVYLAFFDGSGPVLEPLCIYKCIYPHGSQKNWMPVIDPTLNEHSMTFILRVSEVSKDNSVIIPPISITVPIVDNRKTKHVDIVYAPFASLGYWRGSSSYVPYEHSTDEFVGLVHHRKWYGPTTRFFPEYVHSFQIIDKHTHWIKRQSPEFRLVFKKWPGFLYVSSLRQIYEDDGTFSYEIGFGQLDCYCMFTKFDHRMMKRIFDGDRDTYEVTNYYFLDDNDTTTVRA